MIKNKNLQQNDLYIYVDMVFMLLSVFNNNVSIIAIEMEIDRL